ncbi:hypothetical protein [Luteimonas sp. A501]
MTAKRTTKEAPAKAGAKRSAASAKLAQDREHFRGYMRAYEAFKDAMATDEYDPALEAFERAMERVSREMPDEARAIEAAFAATNEMWDRATAALIDANYHECERRAIAPELTRSKDKSRQGKARWKGAPSQLAKSEIRKEWDRWQRREVSYKSDAEFGRKMHGLHGGYESDRSIAQLSARWRMEAKSK